MQKRFKYNSTIVVHIMTQIKWALYTVSSASIQWRSDFIHFTDSISRMLRQFFNHICRRQHTKPLSYSRFIEFFPLKADCIKCCENSSDNYNETANFGTSFKVKIACTVFCIVAFILLVCDSIHHSTSMTDLIKALLIWVKCFFSTKCDFMLLVHSGQNVNVSN